MPQFPRTTLSVASSQQSTKMLVDLSALPAPSERVFANGCAVIDHGVVFELAFTQSRPKGITRLGVSLMVSVDTMVGQFWKSSVGFLDTERAVLAHRDADVQVADLEEAVDSFIDPLDPELLALQELAAVLACSDRRYLPERLRTADRAALVEQFAQLRARAGRR